ncbi:MAG: undecaprenyl-diphosphate phosphatase [Enterococcaceae bacterium]|nr:undecaprenyl-diphosphate phosphatase [Enterococcaceae bacterium]MCI1919896.1 undecaprenyl-diphosphate phosphatase [Enterococcaceae bacterium]
MNLIELLKAVILGIIEGITEWLPISSTGHLILANQFIKLDLSADFMEMFNVVIQLGAILAVVVLYFYKLNPFSPSKDSAEKHNTWVLWLKVIIACLPAIIIGLPFDDYLDAHFYNFITVAAMLILYGVLFIVVENHNKGKTAKFTDLNNLPYQIALFIGIFQVLALIPGTSRSGATILGAIMIGASRYVATEFSFFLGIPVMFGASGLKIFKFLLKGNHFTFDQTVILLTGCVVAFLVSILAIKFLLNYLKRNDFKAFGWYRIVLGIILLGYWFF